MTPVEEMFEKAKEAGYDSFGIAWDPELYGPLEEKLKAREDILGVLQARIQKIGTIHLREVPLGTGIIHGDSVYIYLGLGEFETTYGEKKIFARMVGPDFFRWHPELLVYPVELGTPALYRVVLPPESKERR